MELTHLLARSARTTAPLVFASALAMSACSEDSAAPTTVKPGESVTVSAPAACSLAKLETSVSLVACESTKTDLAPANGTAIPDGTFVYTSCTYNGELRDSDYAKAFRFAGAVAQFASYRIRRVANSDDPVGQVKEQQVTGGFEIDAVKHEFHIAAGCNAENSAGQFWSFAMDKSDLLIINTSSGVVERYQPL